MMSSGEIARKEIGARVEDNSPSHVSPGFWPIRGGEIEDKKSERTVGPHEVLLRRDSGMFTSRSKGSHRQGGRRIVGSIG